MAENNALTSFSGLFRRPLRDDNGHKWNPTGLNPAGTSMVKCKQCESPPTFQAGKKIKTYQHCNACNNIFSIFVAKLRQQSSLPNPLGESAQIATMPMTADVVDGINNVGNVNTNPYPNNAISPGSGNSVPVTSDINSGINDVNINPYPNNAISPGGSGGPAPITSGADSDNQPLGPNNTNTFLGTARPYQQVENSTFLFSNNQFPNTGTNGDTLTNTNEPLEGGHIA
jgi:hypothetical protein